LDEATVLNPIEPDITDHLVRSSCELWRLLIVVPQDIDSRYGCLTLLTCGYGGDRNRRRSLSFDEITSPVTHTVKKPCLPTRDNDERQTPQQQQFLHARRMARIPGNW
jgi:hypothetical protein